MKNSKKAMLIALTSFGAISLAGCDWFKKQEKIPFDFSIGLQSGANVVEKNSKQKIVVYNNGEDTAGRSYTYSSNNTNVASIDKSGNITFKKAGSVNFTVTETKSKYKRALKKQIVVIDPASTSKGGYNYSGGTSESDLAKRAEILGKLEKYAMDTHLTGITLFDNGGYVRYSNRIKSLPVANNKYIQGYGFGILTDGTLTGTLPGKEGKNKPTYYHSAISQDSLKINQYTATGSQVSDLASHITSSYWGTILNSSKTDYDWYPLLAEEYVKKPVLNEAGEITGFEASALNKDPIPMEAENTGGLYRKWRVYVKVDNPSDPNGRLQYTTASSKLSDSSHGFNGRGVALEDYMFAYKLLLTGSNGLIRGTEMANDSSYGIKGASLYYSETENVLDAAEINTIWNSYVGDKLGLKSGVDAEGQPYLDFELVNPIDEFTAKYTLSSNLVSPLPEDLFIGPKSISTDPKFPINNGQFKNAANIYGTFNGELADNKILDYTLCLGAYTLTEWKKLQAITFKTNADWFEVKQRGRYKIPGVYYRVYDTSSDSEKLWKQLEAGNLDSAGVPSSKIKEWKDPTKNVFETKGDSTFKLNVNSCTKAEWNKLFGPNGKIAQNQKWDVKPWMSNQDFLDGLFYSINRKAFADKRGVTPSVNYFSDAYQMRNSEGGSPYNATNAHKSAVNGFETITKGNSDYGYNKDKAIQCFRNAVQQLSRQKDGIVLGTREKPTTISIHIRWMYQTDIKEYGEDIKNYFETAFNDPSVCGGRVKLSVKQDAVTNWEDVYNKYMMKGCFDLGFGAISGNTYNPLNFFEVLKSDNSSNFTLNWGPDTSKVDAKNPIVYDGKKWSFDALWEVADHGGLVNNGEKIDPLKKCTFSRPKKLSDSSQNENDLENGFTISYPIEFNDVSGAGSTVSFDASRLDIYLKGAGNKVLVEKGREENLCTIAYDKNAKKINITITKAQAEAVETWIKNKKNYTEEYTGSDEWKNHPFDWSKQPDLFEFELYYKLTINGVDSVNYAKISK